MTVQCPKNLLTCHTHSILDFKNFQNLIAASFKKTSKKLPYSILHQNIKYVFQWPYSILYFTFSRFLKLQFWKLWNSWVASTVPVYFFPPDWEKVFLIFFPQTPSESGTFPPCGLDEGATFRWRYEEKWYTRLGSKQNAWNSRFISCFKHSLYFLPRGVIYY